MIGRPCSGHYDPHNHQKEWHGFVSTSLFFGTLMIFFGLAGLTMYYLTPNAQEIGYSIALFFLIFGGFMDLFSVLVGIFCYITDAD